MAILLLLTNIAVLPDGVFAASAAPLSGNIIVTNNLAGKSDTVYIYGLDPGDLVKIYDSANGSKVLAYGTVPKNKIEMTFSIAQIGTGAGSLYISVISKGESESSRTKVNYDAEPKSDAISAENVTISNNAQKSDTITVSGLDARDTVRVYSAASGGKVLASKTVSSSADDLTINVTQLGSEAGSVYVTVTKKNMGESDRTKVDYVGEPKSSAPSADNITINNNTNKTDTVYVSGLNSGDLVKVYSADGERLLGSKKVSATGSDATISVSQLGAKGGYILISVTSSDYAESNKILVAVQPELVSEKLNSSCITVTNNSGKPDIVYVTGLADKDVIKVYNLETKGSLLGTATASGTSGDATVSIPQLGSDSGSVFVSVTNADKNESPRVQAYYGREIKTGNISAGNVVVTNNVGKADTVYITGLTGGDTVRIYNTAGKVLGSSTIKDSAYDTTISVPQLGTDSGKILVSLTNYGKSESDKIEVLYGAELKSDAPDKTYINITNNAGKADTIYITKLSSGDIVKVYNSYNSGTVVGTGTVEASKSDLTITIPQLGTNAGSVYIAVTSTGKAESARTYVDYAAESSTAVINTNNISITNNVSMPDIVYVTGLTANTIVTVYSAETSGSVLGSATVASGKTDATVTISQLGVSAGKVYITITQPGMQESARIKAEYSAEGVSATPGINNIVVANNVGKSDTVYISGLSANDTVRIYDAATQGKTLGTTTVANSATDATVNIAQLGTAAGSIYITVTSTGMAESSRVKVDYKAESVSGKTDSENITVTNNAGKADTVYITRLSAGDTVKVYDSSLGGSSLGSATVASGSTDVTVSIGQLGTDSGKVYVTVTSPGKSESQRIEAAYSAEVASALLNSSQVVVTNNIIGTPDTICVTGLSAGDVIKVYTAESQGTRLGIATVVEGEISATISVAQLGTATGSVYVSVTNTGKLEGKTVEAKYAAEGKSLAPAGIKVTNNAGASDTVYVTGLTANDVVKVYDLPKGGKLLGTETVTLYSSTATVSVPQLGSTEGKVYVSVTSSNKAESERTESGYEAEPLSSETNSGNITVTNNAGSSDTVKVTGLTAGDVVKVYDTEAGGNTLGSATVSTNSTETTVTVAQLGSSGGKVYITVTGVNKLESKRTVAEYGAETKPEPVKEAQVTVENNSGIASTVTVNGLKDNDIIKVYDSSVGGNLLGTGTVQTYGSEVTVQVSQLNTTGGKIYISVTSTGKLESDRTAVSYNAKEVSNAPDESSVIIENNYGIADTITVKNLDSNTVVKAYSGASGGSPLGMASVSGGKTEATISIMQLGAASGTVYITVTNVGKTESSRTKVNYSAEGASDPLAAGNVSIVNNSGMADTITVTGLEADSVVKIYNAATGGSRLASATADSSTLSATINISQLGVNAGSVYVSVTRPGKSESFRTEVQYEAESVAAKTSNINIQNYAGMSDVITVTGLAENDVIRAYDAASNGNLLGSGMVSAGSNKASIYVAQLTKNAGSVYISVTNYGRAESKLTKASYIAEQNTTAPYIGDIYAVNNVDIDDTITVYNLIAGDVVLVYSDKDGNSLLGYATVPVNKTEGTVTIKDLGAYAGTIYVSVITKGKNESALTAVSYVAESKSTAPYSGYIYVSNNVTIADTVLVSNLQEGDKVKIYNASTGGDLLGYATATSSTGQVTISIPQLGVASGSVYVSVTSKGKTESNRTKAEYVSEQTTNEPYIGYIDVVNNAGSADKITISNVSPKDVVKVYDSVSDGNLLKSATVAAGSTTALLSLTLPGTGGAGSIYITLTSPGKAESDRVKVDYNAE
jgi:hypothetical protein